MKLNQAVVIGVNDDHHGVALRGAVQDAIDVASRLQARGVSVRLLTYPVLPDHILPDVPRGPATVSRVQDALHAASDDLDEQAITLVHVSGRGRAGEHGPELILADGVTRLTALTTPFADHPIRSVAFVIDAGFDGSDGPGQRSCGPRVPATAPLLQPDDPMLLAGGLNGTVHERPIAGRVRGVFTRMLTAVLDDPETDRWDLGQLMQVLRRIPGEPELSPVLLPAADVTLGLAAAAPWRGIDAVFQWQPTHDFSGFPGFGADGDWEQFDFGGAPPFPPGQFQVGTNTTGGPQQPPGPGVVTFDNNPFGPSAPNPPSVAATDRVYAVTASWGLGGSLFVVFRDAAGGNAQSAEWYTNISNPGKLDTANGSLTFTEAALPSITEWQQSGPWVSATQARR